MGTAIFLQSPYWLVFCSGSANHGITGNASDADFLCQRLSTATKRGNALDIRGILGLYLDQDSDDFNDY